MKYCILIIDGAAGHPLPQRGGKTCLELALKSAAFIKDGQKSLDLIFSIGPSKSFTPYHSFRGSQTVGLAP